MQIVKQVSLIERTNMLDKVNLKITGEIFECKRVQRKLQYKLDVIQSTITIQHELEDIEAQQGESYKEKEIISQYWIHRRI